MGGEGDDGMKEIAIGKEPSAPPAADVGGEGGADPLLEEPVHVAAAAGAGGEGEQEGRQRGSSVTERLSAGFMSAMAKATEIGAKANEIGSKTAKRVATSEKGQKVLQTVDKGVKKVHEYSERAMASEPGKKVEAGFAKTASIVSKSFHLAADEIAVGMAGGAFNPNAPHTVFPLGEKPITVSGMVFHGPYAVVVCENTSVRSVVENLLASSDRPRGRVMAYSFGPDGSYNAVAEASMPAGASSVAATFGRNRLNVFVGLEDGCVQMFHLSTDGKLTNEYGVQAHTQRIVAVNHVSDWSFTADAGAGAGAGDAKTEGDNNDSDNDNDNDSDAVMSPKRVEGLGHLVLGSTDGFIRIFSVDDRVVLRSIQLSAPISSLLAVSQAYVAVGTDYGNLAVLDFTTNDHVPAVTTNLATVHTNAVTTLVADNTSAPFTMYTCGGDGIVMAVKVDAITPAAPGVVTNAPLGTMGSISGIVRFSGHASPVRSSVWCTGAGPNKTGMLVTGDSMGWLFIWFGDAQGSSIAIQAHTRPISTLVWHAPTGRLFSSGDEAVTRIWALDEIVKANSSAALSAAGGAAPLQALQATRVVVSGDPNLPTAQPAVATAGVPVAVAADVTAGGEADASSEDGGSRRGSVPQRRLSLVEALEETEEQGTAHKPLPNVE